MSSQIKSLVKKLNSKAKNFEIGQLQEIRKRIKRLNRLPGKLLFGSKTTHDGYAFHYGGRTELQYNVGHDRNEREIRFGVAFSFESSQALPDIAVLCPKVRLFNEYVSLNKESFMGLEMWHWDAAHERSANYLPSPIPPGLMKNGTFIFLGKLEQTNRVDVNAILQTFDRLLPLYCYVESGGQTEPIEEYSPGLFQFRAGHQTRKTKTVASQAEAVINVALRHNEIQQRLYKTLASKFGAQNVGTELSTGNGMKADALVQTTDGFIVYEIKTHSSSRACIREALGQLLEYAHWPDGIENVREFKVVGEAPLDENGKKYLACLAKRYQLKLSYQQV